MKVERGTARVVKPSEEAPASLPKLVPLSSSDLVVPRVHVEVLYAFNAPAPPVSLLEHGLAKVVSVYREWAGRLGKDVCGRPAIELNDEGVVFIEAQADGTIQELMPFHPVPFLRDLVPVNRGVPELLLIQVADGESASAFMNAWASIVKELSLPFEPVHDRSALMARDPPKPTYDHIEYRKPPPKPESEAIEYPPAGSEEIPLQHGNVAED
ncbi:hypothetical protein O6H91_08G049200 [Diphasiastrum complanatum]|uniref:Uncharacterized protein n=1 Tax=Diphasiastrum complanatum TaxID=34168 RepID=A0ACC2CXD7_DIPCM|nr:hypothetical protein O6H91_08G049200 [Diphasiastrum complanatum]